MSLSAREPVSASRPVPIERAVQAAQTCPGSAAGACGREWPAVRCPPPCRRAGRASATTCARRAACLSRAAQACPVRCRQQLRCSDVPVRPHPFVPRVLRTRPRAHPVDAVGDAPACAARAYLHARCCGCCQAARLSRWKGGYGSRSISRAWRFASDCARRCYKAEQGERPVCTWQQCLLTATQCVPRRRRYDDGRSAVIAYDGGH